jgi:hypothetical protein
MPGRRLTAPQRDQPGFCRAIEDGRTGGPRGLLPGEGGLQCLFDQTLSDAKHGIDSDRETLGHLGIRPGRPIRIGF